LIDPNLIVILGTIEPRKNIRPVLQMLGKYPHFAADFRFVFVGRIGWGEDLTQLLRETNCLDLASAGKIYFSGFLPDVVKSKLLAAATLVVYPSHFEGFGLPVLEALAHGAGCLTTRSSSIFEAGGDEAFYFDPFDLDDFERKFITSIRQVRLEGPTGRARRRTAARRASWSDTYRSIVGAIRDTVKTTELSSGGYPTCQLGEKLSIERRPLSAKSRGH